MPTADEMLGGVTGPRGAVVPPARPQTAEQMLGGVTGPRGTTTTTATQPPPAADTTGQNWFSRNPLGYISGKLISGAMQFGAPFVAGQDVEMRAAPWAPQNMPPMAPQGGAPAANQLVFGTPTPTPPDPYSGFIGNVAEDVIKDPFTVAMPGASLTAAAAGEGAKALGAPPWLSTAASMAGAGVYGAGKAGVEAIWNAGFLRRLADTFGSSETRQGVGTVAKAEADSWMHDETNPGSMPARETEAWSNFDNQRAEQAQLAPGWPEPKAEMTETEKTLKSILKIGADDPRETDLAALAGGGAAKRLWLQLIGEGPAAKPPPVKILGGGKAIDTSTEGSIAPLSFDALKGERTRIGQGMKDTALRPIGQVNLNRIYGAMTKDMQNWADNAGLRDGFDTANGVSENLRDLAKKYIGRIDQARDAEAAFKEVMKGSETGGTQFEVIRNELPNLADELTSMHLRQMINNPGVWNRLAPEAQAQLVRDPAKLEQVRNTMKVQTPGEDTGTKAVKSILGGEIGADIGQATLDTIFGEARGRAVGRVLGATLPPLWRGGATLVRHPASLRYPAIGVASAPDIPTITVRPNALSPPQ